MIFISSLSFMGYGIAYFLSAKMKSEFRRFGLEKTGTLSAVLKILEALGLLIGLKFNIILMVSAGGLAILMLLGGLVRVLAAEYAPGIKVNFFYMWTVAFQV